MNRLYFGDNLDVLRGKGIKDESVDLIYLDPPFNSNSTYNILFKTPKGQRSAAQVTAFEDTWRWGPEAEIEFNELLRGPSTSASELLQSLRSLLGESDMMAYLTMMASRLVELRRVLKPQGTLYLHCDPTASHYLKILLDGIFGFGNFRNEISWRRSQPKSHTKINFPNCRDVILRYSKSEKAKFFKVYGEHDPEYIEKFYRYSDSKGRYRHGDLTNPNKDRPNLTYEFLGVTRVWRWTKERMKKAHADGLIYQSRPGAVPQFKRYLNQLQGQPISDDWDDIEHLHGANSEVLGYPTQKPLALLERIIRASSSEGDVVLDPFCGCGTAVHAAQKLNREWIGIDVTHLAIALIEKRIRDGFPRARFSVYGTPADIDGAADLSARDKYEFQYWACSLVNAQPYADRKKGADGGIDGLIYFQDDGSTAKKIIVSVKGGRNISVQMIRDLRGVLEREKASMALFVTLADPTRPMKDEALKAGYYTSPSGTNFQRIQILTIEGLLATRETPKYPDLASGGHTFRRTHIDHGVTSQADLFSSPPQNLRVLSKSLVGTKRKAPIRVTEPRTQTKKARPAKI
ncbi:site-specific DNA-methyltransferase [Povalibacter sp.]|uniref:site-specific DNA-methyltransferase n=1 Tax=Povalibacter sp. TaxID=1962978 RepID=UPI002F3E22A9